MSSAFLTLLSQIFGDIGYGSIFFLMALESSIFPVPSEAVMIPAGYLAHTGALTWWGAVLAGGFGSLFGALVNYFILGKWLGKAFLEKYGKWILITEKKYKRTEAFFLRNANASTFIGRFIPIIRHFISIPAGIFRMPLASFVGLTFLGATLWCGVLFLLGWTFGEGVLDLVKTYTHEASIVVVIVSIIAIAMWIKKNRT